MAYYSGGGSRMSMVETLRGAQIYPPESEASLADEILEAVRHFPTMLPRIDMLSRRDGSKQSLVCLSGTVPIHFKGNSYNIPMTIWVTEYHPVYAPLTYVTPTASMCVKPGHQHVDDGGKVHHQYISEWEPNRSSISGLLGILVSVFSKEPPVYARPRNQEGATTSYGRDHSKPYKRNPHTAQQHNSYHSSSNSHEEEERLKRELITKATGKLRAHFEEGREQLVKDYSGLIAERDSLRTSQKTIEDGLSGLSLEHSSFNSKMDSLREESAELDRWLTKNEYMGGEVEIDNIMGASDVATKQVLDTLAEDLSTQDMLYVLDEALEAHLVDHTFYLRETRRLARQQFFARALLRKVKLSQAEQERHQTPGHPPKYASHSGPH